MIWLPPMIFGVLSTIAAGLSLLLPDYSKSHLVSSIREITQTVSTITFGLNEKQETLKESE